MANRLADATSPYLLQHQRNPVAWQPWDDQALAEAKSADKPILLSVGYAACHWCHVMAHESFENESIARLMNEHFVCIKVDREERPDLDQIYQHALALLGQQGGWPLTMFLTPDGEPFWGGTYFPPEPRHGRPGFDTVLESVDRIWRDERPRALGNVGPLRQALSQLSAIRPGPAPSAERALDHAQRIADLFDTVNGGLAGAPKFPQVPILMFLWQQAVVRSDRELRHLVLHSLRRMAQGGIYDHLGGGFARYAVDSIWLVPHFEKMLYDNALLVRLLSDAAAAAAEPLFVARVEETIGWLTREMRLADGLASSLDADSEGEEGRFYVWTAEEIDDVLGPFGAEFRLTYGVTRQGNFEGRNILHRLHQPGLADPEQEARLREAAAALLQRREQRPRPERDDKILADWNALTIGALCRAAAVFGRDDWLELAITLFNDVCRIQADRQTIRHSARQGRTLDLGFVDDYAFMSDAALMLFGQTGDNRYLERARAWVAELERSFAHESGAFLQAPETTPHLLVASCQANDGPTPSANGTMIGVLIRLAVSTGEERYRQRARQIAEAFGPEAERNPLGYATVLRMSRLIDDPVQVVIVGEVADPRAGSLRTAAAAHPDPDVVVIPVASTDQLSSSHPAAGKRALDEAPTAYVCRGPVCQPPVTDPADLRRQLDTR